MTAVDYLIKNPSKKQILSGDALSWSQTPSWTQEEPLLKCLLTMIRRVRNNLFHGGKFPGAPVKDPTRDQLLLEYSICILVECLCLDAAPAHKVRKYFRSET
ncbi:hypothetical protein NIES2101_09090 [Calothrix sp. HK-06]|nr:hypothetical protein NIES2101_09090 [Calothrix sp. HK-06]